MKIHTYKDATGNTMQCITGDDGSYEIVGGKIVPKTAATLKTEALAKVMEERVAAYAAIHWDDLRFNDIRDGTTTEYDTRVAIKLQYPKPV